MADGSRSTFWLGTHYSPAPLRANNRDVPWLPDEYQHGYAVMITYYLDRPTVASEVFIDPISTEPFDLISVAYTPYGISNILNNGTFEASGSWTYGTNTSRVANYGVGNSYAAMAVAPIGFISQTFDLVTALNKSVSGFFIPAVSGDVLDTRTEVVYSMKGLGDCYAGARLVWLDSSGSVINYKLKQDFPTGFYRTLRLIDYAPSMAVSGRIDIGIFNTAATASAFFDSVNIFFGEQRKSFLEVLDRPKSFNITNRSGGVLSSRFSFVFAQRNPRRENFATEKATKSLNNSPTSPDISSSTKVLVNNLAASLTDSGNGQPMFAYRIGLKELDLRYREFIPRGRLISYPLNTKKEIRRLWITAELSKLETEGTKFFIYPYASDDTFRAEVQPFRVGNFSNNSYASQGDILYIFTKEEEASGWVKTSNNTLAVDVRQVKDKFTGTDRNGKIDLTRPAHLRRPYLESVSSWLDNYSIRPGIFDPNAEILYGISDQTTKNLIQTNDIIGLTMAASSIASRSGYLPLKITIKTDKWIAYPDTFGKPDKTTITPVGAEVLSSASVTDTATSRQDNVMSFGSWLNNTTFRDFQALDITDPAFDQLLRTANTTPDRKLGNYIDSTPNTGSLRQKLFYWYNRLKAGNKIPQELSDEVTRTAALSRTSAYKTKYFPIITGPNGIYFNLFWYNSETGEYQTVPRASYEVDPTLGLVSLLSYPPASGFTGVVASYWYSTDNVVEDFISGVFTFITETASGPAHASTLTSLRARHLPITRNMTDYVNGKVPELRTPDFDKLSKDYYPVIEYYLNSDNQVQFSRDFFKFGDIPADIEAEYDTLGINPRTSIEVTRSGNPTTSTSISSLSLFVREGNALPTRSIN